MSNKPDHEVSMARADLYKIAEYAIKLHRMLKEVSEEQGLEGWMQSKITKASDYVSSVYHTLSHDMKFGEGDDLQVEAYGRYDRRDAYQRDYDHSVAGMGRRQSRAYQNDGGANDERHDRDPTDWYFVKDGKMFAVSVYPHQEREAMARGYSRTRSEAKAKASNEGAAEGWKGELAGGTIGGIAGNLAGSALGGSIGGIVGGAVGGAGGGIIGRELTKEEQMNEFAPILAAGARLVITMAPKIAQVLKNTGKATAKAAAPVAKSGAEIAAKNADKIGVGLGAYEIGSSAADIAKAITAKVGTALEEKTIMELAQVAFKFAIPAGIVLAILYGGKKVIDSLFNNSNPQQGVAEATEYGIPDSTPGQLPGGAKMTFGEFKKMWPGVILKRPSGGSLAGSVVADVEGWMNNPKSVWEPLQGVAEGSGTNKTHLAMAYLKAVVMAPTGTPDKRRILNWQQTLSNQFDIDLDTAALAQMLPQFDSMLQAGKLDKLQNRMASRGELYIESAEQDVAEGSVEENKKGVRAPKHTTKPRNFVAKNAVQSGAGAHKDKKKAAKQGDTKHKSNAYENRLEAALQSALMEKAPKGWEGTVKAMKKHDEIDNPYALAHWMKNKGYKSHKKK